MFRLHYPVTFLAALLCAQPMELYSSQSQFADTRRHGDKMLPPAGYPDPAGVDDNDGDRRLGDLVQNAVPADVEAADVGRPVLS